MRKLSVIILSVVILFAFASCTSSETDTTVNQNKTQLSKTEESDSCFPSVTNSLEYTLYQNIFYNEQGAKYENQSVTKTGTFSILYDEYYGSVRYYCWGYYDNTKCCDWQWEFVPTDTTGLPSVGSLIEVTGVFTKSDNALDGYWISDATYNVKQEFKGPDCDIDMTSMSATLERVQIQNLQFKADKFEGKTVAEYGRVKTDSSIQHPYYDDAWEQTVTLADSSVLPAIGTYVVVTGTVTDSNITNGKYEVTTNY